MEQFISGTETKPLETIALMQPRMVAGLLEKEHPQTVALVLSTQHVEHASEIIANLPDEMQADVVYRIAKIEKVSRKSLVRLKMHSTVRLVLLVVKSNVKLAVSTRLLNCSIT